MRAGRRAATAPVLALVWGLVGGPATAQRQTPPQGGPPRDFKLPAARTFQLDDGLGVTLVSHGTVPKARVSLVVRVGNLNEGPAETWLADLTGDLMREGTTARSGEQLAAAAAGMGGAITVSVGPDQTTIGGEVLEEFTPDFVRLVADVARNPRFPESELGRLKADRARDLSVAQREPGSITLERFRRVMYPDHPYGRVFPTVEQVNGYTLEQVRRFHAANFGAARSHLYVLGRFDAARVEGAARAALGDWARGPEPLVNVPTPRSGRDVQLIDRPGAPQSTIYLGLPVVDPSHPDWVALQVTNTLLGGFFGSRITRNIREQKGYTYAPRSQVSARYRDAYWVEIADVTTSVTGPALQEIFKEIATLRAEAPPADELRGIQNYLAGTFVLQNSSRSGIAGQLTYVRLHGLGDDYLSNYVRRVHGVTAADVQRIARQYLVPERMLIVVTGDLKQIEEQVAPFRSVVPSSPD
ncbi:MAG TPA: pitrilysin family protein [Gemmatimonadales bacterium]|nr:pitrilysin family protein [Gemmatimonadales bacterium]